MAAKKVRRPGTKKKSKRCSFCRSDIQKVYQLVAGTVRAVHICDQCVGDALELLCVTEEPVSPHIVKSIGRSVVSLIMRKNIGAKAKP